MSDPLFLQLLARAVDELNDERPTDVPEATKRRWIPGEEVKAPRMAVMLGDEEADLPRAHGDPLTRRRALLTVECIGPVETPEEADAVCAPAIAWATAVLGATNLNGLAHYVRELRTQRRPQMAGDRIVMVMNLIFEISYQTRRNDLTRKS